MLRTYRGDSTAVAKVMTATPAGVPVPGQTYAVWCNGKSAPYVAQSGDSAASVVAGLVAAIANSPAPEFEEMLASAAGNTLTLTAATPGVPFDVTVTFSGNLTVVETTAGSGPVDEAWSIALIGTYTGGTFTVTCNVGSGNVTTGNIAYNATAATVQTALAALSGVGAGQVLVTGAAGGTWYVTWTGTLAGQAIAAGTVNASGLTGGANVIITEQQAGNGLSDTIQFLDCSAATVGGATTFTLTLNGQTTAALSILATAATIQSALQGLANIGSGNVSVYSSTEQNSVSVTYAIHFGGTLAATNVNQLVIGGWTGGAAYIPTVTVLQTGGQTTSDDFQWVNLGTLSGGAFTLTYAGQTTGFIGNDYQYPQVTQGAQAALQALSTIGTGNAVVYGPAWNGGGSPYNVNGLLVHFTGALANTRCSLLSVAMNHGSGNSVTRLATGDANTNEIQTIAVIAMSGTFTLTLGAQTTGNIAYNASPSTIVSDLEAAFTSTLTTVTCSGSGTFGNPWIVTVTAPADTPIALMTANASGLSGGAGTITALTAGHAGQNEVQTITLIAGVNGGTFTLAFNGPQPTEAIPWNATGANIQSALLALPTINIATVTGSAGGPWTVTWSGAQSDIQQPLLIADGSLLTGTFAPAVPLVTVTFSSGPNHYDDPNNWSPMGVPNTLDGVLFDPGSSACLYGIDQISTFQISSNVQSIAVSATGGTFTLTDSTQTTGAIAYNASASAVAAAILAAFTSTVTSVTATGAGTAANPWVVTMFGPNGFSQPLMTANAGSLTGGSGTVTISANQLLWTGKSAIRNGQTVYLTTTNTLPAGFATGTTYYVCNANRDTKTFQLATSLGGTPIGATSLGTGTHTGGIRLESIELSARWSTEQGLPRENSSGYLEYRQRYLHIGLATAGQGGAQTVTIGTDEGSGQGKVQIDNDVDQAAWYVIQTGSSFDTDARDVLFKGTNPLNTLEVVTGDVAVALFEGEAANLASVKLRGGTLELGEGVTVTGPVIVTAGNLICDGCTINGIVTL